MSVDFRTEGRRAYITLNRPQKANAAGASERRALREAFEEARLARYPVLILSGAGGKVFCAGADLSELPEAKSSPGNLAAFNADWATTTDLIARYPGLVVARINGIAAGGGMALALACDIRLAAEHAEVFYPVIKNGVSPPVNDVNRLIAAIGPGRARALLMGARRIDAATAELWGAFDFVCPAAELDTQVKGLTEAALEGDYAQLLALKAEAGD